MKIVNGPELEGFKKKHAPSRKSLAKWEAVVTEATWQNFSEVTATFSTASYVEGRTVFNVGGGKYRVSTVISYCVQTVLVERAMTHEEYDREGWKG